KVCNIKPVVLVKKIGNPEEIDPPDRVGQELPGREGPGLAMRDQPGPCDFCSGLWRFAPNIVEFRPGQAWVFFRPWVEDKPENTPEEAKRAGAEEGRAPSIRPAYKRDGKRRD